MNLGDRIVPSPQRYCSRSRLDMFLVALCVQISVAEHVAKLVSADPHPRRRAWPRLRQGRRSRFVRSTAAGQETTIACLLHAVLVRTERAHCTGGHVPGGAALTWATYE